MTIITNNVPRKLLYGYELPENQRSEFDYLNDEEFATAEFVRYRGWYYCLDQFMRDGAPSGWDGCHCDSFFSAVLIKFARDEFGNLDEDNVIIGLALA